MDSREKKLEKAIALCKENNRKGQKRLFEMYAPAMLALCRRYTSDPMDAEDWLMEGFMNVFRGIKNYEPTGSFSGWIKTVIMRTCITKIRVACRRKIDFEPFDEATDYGQDDNIDIRANEYSMEFINKCISSLPDMQRMVFNLSAIDGCSNSEIGSMLEISTESVKTTLCRAKKTLREMLLNDKNIK